MSNNTHKTRGIVLRTVKYGETSIIVTIYTQIFGLQSYIVNGVRKTSKNGSNKAAFFQPDTVLEMEVYHNSLRQLHRIKEYQIAIMLPHLFTNVLKHGVALFMVELLTKCLKEPETQEDLYYFLEDSLHHLNNCTDAVMANFPIFYATHLSGFFGFFPRKNYLAQNEQVFFDMKEGCFSAAMPAHNQYLEQQAAIFFAELSMARQPAELEDIRTNAATRRKILQAIEAYYALHIQDFGKLKTLPVLRELLQ
ncbi:MAG: DNA repair protein RecO [Niabella sp.]